MAASAPKAGWYRDPTGRHDLRKWDGDGWSEWVMDGSRRHFDDIDGCGGPPVGEIVAVDGGPSKLSLLRGAGAGAGAGSARRRRGGRFAPRAGSSSPPRSFTPSTSPLTAGPQAATGLRFALITTIAATIAAGAVVAGADRDLVEVLFSDDPAATLRRFAEPLVLAAVVFEAVAAIGLVVAFRRAGAPGGVWSAVRIPTSFTRDDLLRGSIAFLLALFGWTFLVSAVDGPAAASHWWPATVGWLLGVEAIVTVVVAPVVEERLFRGLLLAGLRERFGPVVGVLGQAAIYGAAQAWAMRDASRPGTVLGIAAIGAVFGWMAHTTNDLKPVMVAHGFLSGFVLLERLLGW